MPCPRVPWSQNANSDAPGSFWGRGLSLTSLSTPIQGVTTASPRAAAYRWVVVTSTTNTYMALTCQGQINPHNEIK